MNKKIMVSSLLVIFLIYAAFSYIFGNYIKKEFYQNITQQKSLDPYFNLVVEKYDEGWFSSSVAIEIIPHFIQNVNSSILFHNKIAVRNELSIFHGPLIIENFFNPRFAYLKVRGQLFLNFPYFSLLKWWVGNAFDAGILQYSAIYGLDDDWEIESSVPPFSFSLPMFDFKWQGFWQKININSKNTNVKVNLNSGEIVFKDKRVKSPLKEINLPQFFLTAYSASEKLPTSILQMKFKAPSFSLMNQKNQIILLTDIEAYFDMKIVENKIEANMTFKIKDMTSSVKQGSIQSLMIIVNIKIPKEAIDQLLDKRVNLSNLTVFQELLQKMVINIKINGMMQLKPFNSIIKEAALENVIKQLLLNIESLEFKKTP